MDLALRGKSVVVTGGSKGIGVACAPMFVSEGARVGITSRSSVNIERACAELGGVFGFAADLTSVDKAPLPPPGGPRSSSTSRCPERGRSQGLWCWHRQGQAGQPPSLVALSPCPRDDPTAGAVGSAPNCHQTMIVCPLSLSEETDNGAVVRLRP